MMVLLVPFALPPSMLARLHVQCVKFQQLHPAAPVCTCVSPDHQSDLRPAGAAILD